MKFFDKFMDVMRLNPDDDEDDFYDDDYDDDDEEDAPAKKKFFHKEDAEDEDTYEADSVSRERPRTVSKITPMRTNKKQNGQMSVCVIKPTAFEDSLEIADTLLMNRTVVLNVEGLDVDIAQRLIDFASGACYAINGNLQKISNYIFIISPESVDISGDFQEILDSFAASSIQTTFR